MFTNINITNNEDQYKYVTEYIQSDLSITSDIWYIEKRKNTDTDIEIDIDIDSDGDGDIIFPNNNDVLICNKNYWYPAQNPIPTKSFCPKNTKSSKIRLYFPQFSLDVYEKGHKYVIVIGTWICGKYIILANHIISRANALACAPKIFFNEIYYEYVDIPIIDPYELMYSDDWKEWRINVCGENPDIKLINSVGSNIYCSLHPVIENEDCYIKLDGYIGGQSSILLAGSNNDYLNLNLTTNIFQKIENCESPKFTLNLNFNEVYDGSLKEYLYETYGLEDCILNYELIIGNENDIYAMCKSPEMMEYELSYSILKNDIDGFENGIGWKPGISVIGSVEIRGNIDNEVGCIYLLSNKLPLTENILRFFIKSEFKDRYNYTINNVNLDDVDMNILNINAINKTENIITKIERVGDNKTNTYQNIFYRVLDAHSIVVRPEVNENVCINLDQYKHLVKKFILQLEGVKFVEIGRTKQGILFKIISSKLPKKQSNGQYYILNQDSELVTSGKYIYEI